MMRVIATPSFKEILTAPILNIIRHPLLYWISALLKGRIKAVKKFTAKILSLNNPIHIGATPLKVCTLYINYNKKT